MILLLAALLGLTPPELRGRELFTKGTSAAGREVSVTIGGGTVTAAMPCASCHGTDGTGRTEGGVTAPDIRWETLMQKYDERGVLRAITLGPRLTPVMPRYHLWREDAADLIAYLKKLSTIREPGITDDTIEIGILLSSPAAPVMRTAVEQWAADVNTRGGIYARRVILRFFENAPEPEEAFVFIGDGNQTPDEAPLVAITAPDAPGPFVFSVSASPADQQRALDAAPHGDLVAARVLPSDIDNSILAHLQPTALIDQLNILAAARLVEETLRRAGRGVTRESFLTTLESTRDLATGYGPPLTFDRTHHHGTNVVRVLRYDREKKTFVRQ